MHNTFLSLQREIESKMCLTGRQHKLWFLGKKRKNVSDWICFILLTDDLWCLFVSFSATTKAGSSDHHQPWWVHTVWFVLMCVCYSVHSTPYNIIENLQWGFTDRIVCSYGLVVGALWLLLHFTTTISCSPRAKTCKKRPFPTSCQHFRDPVVAPRACLSQSSRYSRHFCVSMGSWMFSQCIWVKAETAFRALGETDGVARKDAAPICLKYLAALIHFD